MLYYAKMTAGAFPIMGSMATFDGIDENDTRWLCGNPTLTSRLVKYPVRIPQSRPAATGSISEIRSRGDGWTFEAHRVAET